MPTKITSTTEELTNKLFIARFSALFNECLVKMEDSTKHIIRNNKQLNDMYDLFLDFIIDSNQHLEYNDIKNEERHIRDVGSY